MSIKYYDKSGESPQEKLLAGISPVDAILSGTSKNAIQNKAVFNALKEKIEVTVDHLVYFYNKSEVYNKEEVRALIGAIDTLTMEVVSSLPVSDISTTTIYLLKPSGSSVYDEYVYINNAWVKIGTTDMDLSGYMTTAAFNLAIADYYTKAEIDAMIADYYTKDEIDDILENYDSGQFVGTTAEWNALSLAEKVQYTTAIFTDDDDYVGNIVDAVTDGEMSAVTSNAVFDALALKFDATKLQYGITDASAAKTDGNVSFQSPFADANYIVFLCPFNENANIAWSTSVISKTASGFVFESKYFTNNVWTSYYRAIFWIAIHL